EPANVRERGVPPAVSNGRTPRRKEADAPTPVALISSPSQHPDAGARSCCRTVSHRVDFSALVGADSSPARTQEYPHRDLQHSRGPGWNSRHHRRLEIAFRRHHRHPGSGTREIWIEEDRSCLHAGGRVGNEIRLRTFLFIGGARAWHRRSLAISDQRSRKGGASPGNRTLAAHCV